MSNKARITDAIAEAERWLDHLRAQEQRSMDMQVAARMAREGRQAAAEGLVRKVDNQPRVYDAAKLRDAVIVLVERAKILVGNDE